MKGKTAKLHVNDSVKPLAQKYRRLPFHIRDQVEAELKHLEDLDIVKRAEDGSNPLGFSNSCSPKEDRNMHSCRYECG